MDDQTNIKFLKQEEFNANVIKFNENVVKRLKELEDYTATYSEKGQTNINYSLKRRIEELEDYRVKIYLKLERHDDIVVVHRSQLDGLRKEINEMKRVMNDYLMINLDNPEYITKVHEKRGNHGTDKT